jgi:hypothetical protein
LSTREIAASLGVGQTTVSEYLKRAAQAGLAWPLKSARRAARGPIPLMTGTACTALDQKEGPLTSRIHAQRRRPM